MLRAVLKLLLKLFYRVEVTGLENFDKAGKRVLVVANHTSFLDAVLLYAFLPDDLSFAINTHISQNKFLKPILKHVSHFPMDPTNPYAAKTLIDILKHDRKCAIFPEGRITVTGSLMKIYEGPGMIADKSGSSLLPVKIDGAQYTPFSRLKGKMRTHYFPKIKLTVLEPVNLNIDQNIKGRERRRVAGQFLHNVMQHTMFAASNLDQTLFKVLIDAKSLNGNSHIIAEDIARNPITYHKLITANFLFADKFSKFVKQSDYVGVMLPNSVANLTCFFALQALNAVPAMLNYSIGSKNLMLACKTAQIKHIISSRTFIEKAKLTAVVTDLEQQNIKIHYMEDIRQTISLPEKLTALFKAYIPDVFYKPVNASSPAVILFTSGSEGSPKGVVLSHRNINANRIQLGSVIDFNPTDKVLNALPMFHSFGLTGATLLPVLAGLKVFFYPSPLHYRIVPEICYDTNSTIIFGTDTFLAGYAKFAHPYDFYSVRYVFAGAEKLKDETRKKYSEKYGVRIFEGYGATETAPALALNTPMHKKNGTVGKLLPGIESRIEPIPGIEEGGRLHVKGPNIMLGYLLDKNPGVLVPPANNEYDTGDIVSIDEEGYVAILGRAKRFAKIGGEMVSLTAVESFITNLWPDNMHAVINIPDEKKGEQLVLITDNKTAERSDISAYTKANGISELSIPKKIIKLDKLPVLGTGKVDYVSLKDVALDN